MRHKSVLATIVAVMAVLSLFSVNSLAQSCPFQNVFCETCYMNSCLYQVGGLYGEAQSTVCENTFSHCGFGNPNCKYVSIDIVVLCNYVQQSYHFNFCCETVI